MLALRLAALLIPSLLIAACGGGGGGGDTTIAAAGSYDAFVTRTSLGIPHIRAIKEGDFGSVGYGYGYAQAEDDLCLLMEDLVTIKGQRARYFGGAGSYTIYANSSTANNVDSDFFWVSAATPERIAALKHDMLPAALAGTVGFADGFNRYVREIKAGGHPGRHAACRDSEWLREITLDDMLRRYFRLGVLASSSVFASGIAQAQPPLPSVASAKPARPASRRQLVAALKKDKGPFGFFTDPPIGSNMYGIGKDMSATGVPILFGNPHFPWRGTERLYLAHITVPGTADIMGAALYGVPLALIGFNDHFAWSHTVSTAYRFTFYELTLVPGDPTSYVYDGQTYKMEEVPITIDVKGDDGTISQVSRTLYKSRFGPMTSLVVSGQNIFPWSASKAYTLRDANAENTRLINHFFRWNTATSLDEFKRIQRETVAVPWVNTVATGPEGKAYYADITNVPNVPDAKAQQCLTSAQGQAVNQLMPGVYVLDGSTSTCEWDTDSDAPAPGIFGASHLPSLERDDWVGNNNDSYWLTNPAQPVTGYAKIIGPEGTVRSLRTRHSILKQLHRAAGDDGFPGNKWTTEQLKQSVLDAHIYSADLALQDVLDTYCVLPTVASSNGPVSTAEACAALAQWDGSNNLNAIGAHVWREFWRLATKAQQPYLVPFSASDPVNTPNTLDVAQPQVQQAFGDAIAKITAANIPLDARLGSIQHAYFDPSIEIFGGEGNMDGAFTIARADALAKDEGYPISFGNSYMQVVTWERDGAGWKPQADAFVTYSESTDPASPNFNNFTREYSMKNWKRLPFRPDDVTRDKISEVHLKN